MTCVGRQAGSIPARGTMNGENGNMDYYGYDLADVITGRPHDFRVGKRRFGIYPVTLGKALILRPYMEAVGMEPLTGSSPYASAIMLAKEKRKQCAAILAIHTARNTREGLLCQREVQQRTDFFARELGDEDLASLLFAVLTNDKTPQIIRHLGLDKEQDRLSEAIRAKGESRNCLNFGGRGVFGSFIAPLKEMGFTIDEIIFECGYGFLRLMLMDRRSSVYLSDEELQGLCGSAGALIDGDGADADSQLGAFFASKGLNVK